MTSLFKPGARETVLLKVPSPFATVEVSVSSLVTMTTDLGLVLPVIVRVLSNSRDSSSGLVTSRVWTKGNVVKGVFQLKLGLSLFKYLFKPKKKTSTSTDKNNKEKMRDLRDKDLFMAIVILRAEPEEYISFGCASG